MVVRPYYFSPDSGSSGSDPAAAPGKKAGEAGEVEEEGQDNSDGEGGEGNADNTLPTDPEELRAFAKKLVEDKKHYIQVHGEMKEKFRLREAADAKAKQEALAKQGEYKQLYETMQPEYEQMKATISEYEETLNTYLETELKDVPASFQDLLPEGNAATKLAWLAKAKVSGVLKLPASKGKSGSAQNHDDGAPPPGKKGAVATADEYNSWPAKKQAEFLKNGGTLE